ncbi:restriction endonuclease subunit S [Nitrosomonas halophila]|uniref:Type I restriction enzyme, S subunit n=1 Tax=Nitrosomonas halophila TaxID=44576 RepID=A0A1H3DX59_9PROT|nr:restriction endonuclease subunit S [Nitrosomonas halophila]SDX71016.1 type I restriction enzyme, S subunit [Nitrosomonas halophila]
MNNHQVAEVSAEYLTEATGNAVPAGYKQTEVGVIPEDWETKQLGDLVYICSGESPSKFQFQSDGVPYFKVEQLNNGVVYAEATPYFVLTSKVVPAGSVIFPKRGASIFSNKIRVLKTDSFMDTNLMTLTCSASLDELYLYNQLAYRGIDSVADTTSIPQINNKHIYPYLIPFPNKEEQTAIANALSDVDALISELGKLIAKKQAIKTATMQQLLTGRTRLPQFALREDGSKKGYKQSELGEIPEDWEIAPFVSLLSIRHGKNQKSVEVENGEYPILATGGQIGWANSYLWDKPSVLIGRKGTIDKPRYADKPFWTVDTLFYSEIKPWVDAKFVYYKFCMIDWMQYNEASGVPSLNASIIEGIRSVIPKKEEQTAIATILSDMDDDIQALEQRLAKTRQIKQGMMQELLTGKTRLV